MENGDEKRGVYMKNVDQNDAGIKMKIRSTQGTKPQSYLLKMMKAARWQREKPKNGMNIFKPAEHIGNIRTVLVNTRGLRRLLHALQGLLDKST